MTTAPDEPQDADPTQLEEAGEAIDEAKAAAGRVARDDSIDTGIDLPTGDQYRPSAPEVDADEPVEPDEPDRRDALGERNDSRPEDDRA